jgi:small-conductance mechanosensitive channel
MDAQRDQRPLGQLFGDLAEQLSTLIRKEMELARTEMTEKVGAVGRDAASIGIGAALAYGGVLVLLGAAILVLIELGLAAWVAALVVGLLAAIVGALLVNSGRSALRRVDLAPRRTVETHKDDAQWAQEQVT